MPQGRAAAIGLRVEHGNRRNNQRSGTIEIITQQQQPALLQIERGALDVADRVLGVVDRLRSRQMCVCRGVGLGQQHLGDLGWVQRAPLRELAEPVEKAAPGDIIGPIESRMGFSIAKVSERRDETPLEDVRAEVEQQVKMDAMRKYMTDVKQAGDVKYPKGEGAGAEPGTGGADEMPEVTPPAPE